MTTCLDAALDYAERLGWRVLPLHSIRCVDGKRVCTCSRAGSCNSPSKHPRTEHGLLEATTDTATIKNWWQQWPGANVGIATGDGLGVLDIDPRNGGSLEELEADEGRLPDTVHALTGGGGEHFYFRVPPDTPCRSNVRPGVDFKADGGYVVAPPSSHPSGKTYEWEASSDPADIGIAEAPEWLLELLGNNQTIKQPHKRNGRPTTDLAERRCLDALRRIKTGDNTDGSKRLFMAACRCVQHDLDDDGALDVIRQYEQEHPFPRQYSDVEILQRIRDAEKRQKRNTAIESEASQHTDVGLAARLVKRYRDVLRYCYGPNQWHVWDKTRWKPDDSGEVVRMAKDTVLAIYDEAKKAETPLEQNEIAAFCRKSQRRERIAAAIDLARPELAVHPVDLDRDEYLFNCLNGTIDLRTGKLRRHDPCDLITKLAPVTYNSDAQAPLWQRFLSRIFDKDVELIRFIQRLFGMCLTADVREQILSILHGKGANGKNVLLDTMCGLMGDYAGTAPPDLLVDSKYREHPTEIADLMGKRLVVASENERNAVLRIQLIKRLTGDAKLKARRMRQDYFEFTRTHKMVLLTNNKPRVFENTVATWRRLRLVPFDVTIPPAEQDKDLLRKLRDEWPGILAWLVSGCLDWLREGLAEPEAVRTATEAYRLESDQLGRFLLECCEMSGREWVAASCLREEFEKWCRQNGDNPMGVKTFATQLKGRGCTPGRKGAGGPRVWYGLRLKSDVSDTSDTLSG